MPNGLLFWCILNIQRFVARAAMIEWWFGGVGSAWAPPAPFLPRGSYQWGLGSSSCRLHARSDDLDVRVCLAAVLLKVVLRVGLGGSVPPVSRAV